MTNEIVVDAETVRVLERVAEQDGVSVEEAVENILRGAETGADSLRAVTV